MKVIEDYNKKNTGYRGLVALAGVSYLLSNNYAMYVVYIGAVILGEGNLALKDRLSLKKRLLKLDDNK